MPNSIDFRKVILLHVITVRIIVPWGNEAGYIKVFNVHRNENKYKVLDWLTDLQIFLNVLYILFTILLALKQEILKYVVYSN